MSDDNPFTTMSRAKCDRLKKRWVKAKQAPSVENNYFTMKSDLFARPTPGDWVPTALYEHFCAYHGPSRHETKACNIAHGRTSNDIEEAQPTVNTAEERPAVNTAEKRPILKAFKPKPKKAVKKPELDMDIVLKMEKEVSNIPPLIRYYFLLHTNPFPEPRCTYCAQEGCQERQA
jgi:hypothetical protein